MACRVTNAASPTSKLHSSQSLPDDQGSSSPLDRRAPSNHADHESRASLVSPNRATYVSAALSMDQRDTRANPRSEIAVTRVPSHPVGRSQTHRFGMASSMAMPYSRAAGSLVSTPQAALISSDDLSGEDQDASRAFLRNLSSPLEILENRATSYFQRISAGTSQRQDHARSEAQYDNSATHGRSLQPRDQHHSARIQSHSRSSSNQGNTSATRPQERSPYTHVSVPSQRGYACDGYQEAARLPPYSWMATTSTANHSTSRPINSDPPHPGGLNLYDGRTRASQFHGHLDSAYATRPEQRITALHTTRLSNDELSGTMNAANQPRRRPYIPPSRAHRSEDDDFWTSGRASLSSSNNQHWIHGVRPESSHQIRSDTDRRVSHHVQRLPLTHELAVPAPHRGQAPRPAGHDIPVRVENRDRLPLYQTALPIRSFRRQRQQLPAYQLNQENSEEAELRDMRREMATAATRHGQLAAPTASNGIGDAERLDETPPPLGRLERLAID